MNNRKPDKEAFAARTARKSFNDSFGNPVEAGERFGILEIRPLFVSRKALEGALAALDAEPVTEDPIEEAK